MSTGGQSERENHDAGLGELCLTFLKLGVIGFGGPAAHLALMHQEAVIRKKWLSDQEFVDLVGATNLIPGPNSTELAIHIGYLRNGWRGLIAAGVCFILPAALIATGLAWSYVKYGTLPEAEAVLRGVKPVVIAIVALALWRLGRTVLRSAAPILIASTGVILSALGFHELLLLFGSGAVLAVFRVLSGRAWTKFFSAIPALPALLLAAPAAAAPASLPGLFLSFAKIGSVLFGSGYVLLAFLRAEFVERNGWLTESQLLDAVAVGQAIPGPTFSTATFVGYLLAGPSGAVAATIGIFLPAFILVGLSGFIVARVRRSAVAGSFLDGVNAASLALMAYVTWELAGEAVVDVWSGGLALLAGAALIRFRINPAWIILGGGAAGYGISMLG